MTPGGVSSISAVWCLLSTSSFGEAVFEAVKLGDDTDTTGCVTGGLAGIYCGSEAIPKEWIKALAHSEGVQVLLDAFAKTFPKYVIRSTWTHFWPKGQGAETCISAPSLATPQGRLHRASS